MTLELKKGWSIKVIGLMDHRGEFSFFRVLDEYGRKLGSGFTPEEAIEDARREMERRR